MDRIQRDTMFAGLTEHDIAEALMMELRRRELFGCLFVFDANEDKETFGKGVFASRSPRSAFEDFSVSQQLALFAELAGGATENGRTSLKNEIDTADTSRWKM